jgi:hypothetical protein
MEATLFETFTPTTQIMGQPTVFNGTYTITSPTGEHRTFRIKTQKDDARFAPGKRTIALLTGSDNDRCLLHNKGLKPSEGRKTSCKESTHGENLHELVAMTWKCQDGKEVIALWEKEIEK